MSRYLESSIRPGAVLPSIRASSAAAVAVTIRSSGWRIVVRLQEGQAASGRGGAANNLHWLKHKVQDAPERVARTD